MDISVLGSERKAFIGLSEKDDTRDSLREASESVAVRIGPISGDRPTGWEIEQAYRAVAVASGEVAVRQGKTAARERSGGRQQTRVSRAASPEVGGSAVEADELIAPRRERGALTGPDAAGQVLPQELRTGNSPPRGAHLLFPMKLSLIISISVT